MKFIFLKKIAAVTSAFLILIILLLALFCYIFYQSLPSVSDAKEKTIKILSSHNGEYEQLPIPLKFGQAIVSVEDRRFYEHHGIDTLGFIKTVFLDKVNDYPNGGATISEQLAKNIYVINDVSFFSKCRVVFLAIKLENTYSKNQILNMYINAIYYGNKNYGIIQASNGYFNTNPYNLNWAEASMLAGLPQAPSYYNPSQNFNAAKFRQKIVLDALTREGILTNIQSNEIYNEKLSFNNRE